MRAKDGFTLAVALAQLLIELFGKRRQTMLQPGIVFRTRRNLTITFQVITLPKRERTCSYAPCQHAAVQQVRVEANQRTRQRVRRQFRRGRLNAIAVNKPVLQVLLQRSPGLFFIATSNGQAATVVKQRSGTYQRQRAFRIRPRILAMINKYHLTLPLAALFFQLPRRTRMQTIG